MRIAHELDGVVIVEMCFMASLASAFDFAVRATC